MKPSKRLALQRHALTDLTTDDLRDLVGGQNTPLCIAVATATRQVTVCRECPSDPVTGCTVIYETQASCVGCTVTCPTDICA